MAPEAGLRIADALAQARALDVDRLDAQWLLCHLLGRSRAWLMAHDDSHLPEPAPACWPAAPGASRWPTWWASASFAA